MGWVCGVVAADQEREGHGPHREDCAQACCAQKYKATVSATIQTTSPDNAIVATAPALLHGVAKFVQPTYVVYL